MVNRDHEGSDTPMTSTQDAPLDAAALESKADALWWTSRIDQSIAVRQQAYAAYVVAGDLQHACFNAWYLSIDYALKGEQATSSGWFMRAKDDLPPDIVCREQALLMLSEADRLSAAERSDDALAHAAEALSTGRRLNDPDVVALATESRGRILIAAGRVDEGTVLLDEAMTSLLARQTTPLFTGMVFCDVLNACMEIADFGRAREWTQAAARWYEGISGTSPFHGICRIHRVEVATLRGAWDEAERDARLAARDLEQVRPVFAAGAHYALGEVLRRRGDLAAAQEEYERAHRLGREPMPGLALLWLARGDLADAAAWLGHAHPVTANLSHQAALLSARVQIAVAQGDAATASWACEQLESLVRQRPAPILELAWQAACAARQLADGRPDRAATAANRAFTLARDLGLPLEAATARLVIGIASRQAGDEGRARLEIAIARDQFEALGADLEAKTATQLLTGSRASGGHDLSAREIEVLRQVAQGRTNRDIGRELLISEHTVARHVQNIFRKLGVTSRTAATAYAMEHDLIRIVRR